MKILAAIMGTAVVLSPALFANAQFAATRVAEARSGDVRVIATAAIREPLNAVLKQADGHREADCRRIRLGAGQSEG
jgi:hypothetical protein